MKLQKAVAVAISAIVIGSIASPAFAGTGVTNSTSRRHIRNGFSRTNTTIDITEIKKATNRSVSVKAESYGGDLNVATVKLGKNGKIKARAHSVRNDRQDPVAIITKATQYEQVDTTTNIAVQAFERYNFSGSEYSHTVESDSF